MTKRYYSKRYTRKRRTKYLVVGLIFIFVALVVVSAYSDIPQLEPIRKQIESFGSGIGGAELSVGETGEIDGLAITLVKYELTDSWIDCYDEEYTAPEGAEYLFIQIKLENAGKHRKTFPGYIDFSLHYAGSKMIQRAICTCPFYPIYIGKFSKYPGGSEEAWLAFEVPKGIELEDTTLEIKGLVWRLG